MATLRDLPVLSGESFDGHAAAFRKERGELFARLVREHRDIGALRFFNVRIVGVHSPELLHELFIEQARKLEKSLALRMAFYPLAGNGLFTSEGDLWKRQRKLMAPLFHPAAVRGYGDMMNDVIARHLDRWRDGDVIDIGREMTRITMGVAGKVLFDADTFDDADELGAAITVMFDYLTDQGASLSLMMRSNVGLGLLKLGALPSWGESLRQRAMHALSSPFPWPTAKRRALFRAAETLDRKVGQMIEERRARGETREDLLSKLLHARDDDGSTMTDRQVRDEAVTLFVAGHETTATSTTWALYFLARHPEVYKKWQQEAQAIGHVPTARDADQMGYTLRVFKEALRIYPPAFLLDRVSTEPLRLRDYDFEKETVFMMCPYALHRRDDIWPDPERFDPDRFTPEQEATRHRLAWMPFGAGPRVCIGAQFAQLEAQLLLTQIAQRFDLAAVEQDPIPVSFLSALRPSRPVRMRVTRKASRVAARSAPGEDRSANAGAE